MKNQDEKAQTFVACDLLKAVECWNDMGLGKELGYPRYKGKREHVSWSLVTGSRGFWQK